MSEFYRHIIVPLLFTVILLASCAPTDELRDDEMERMLDEAIDEYADLAEYMDEMTVEEELDEQMMERLEGRAEELLRELPELAVNLEAYRSRLSDLQTGFRNEIPEIYLESEKPEDESEYRDRNRGFRIQIISTRDARLAEEIQEDFEEWISSVSAPPQPRTYMVFQQPDYRVHVGDFLDRQRALEFADFIRLRYPDAWVVHSRIHPGRVER
ncbi:MAG: SPOR domain-containing protein [Cyclonatronaceae bacterium]